MGARSFGGRRLGGGVLAVALAAAVCALGLPAAPAQAAPGPADAPEYWFDQWHLTDLWATGADGNGVTIAEIDTGVNASLPELAPDVLRGKDFGVPGDGRVDREASTFGHGTAMASIMVAQKGILDITGVAPGAKLLPIAVPLNGTTDAGKDDHLADAIRWAADHGGKVISMSLGGGRHPAPGADPCPRSEQEAIFHAIDKGAIVVAASGNNGPSTNTVEEPGVCLGVVSVGAIDASGAVASFSSRHPYLTLTAPGVNIPSLSRVAGSAYAGDGTSQATAIASAAIAVVWSKYPTLSNRQVLARVLATLDRKRPTRDPAYGYGSINPYRAVTARVAANAPNPVFDGAAPFMARDSAFAAATTRPARRAAGSPTAPLGHVTIGSAPRVTAPTVLTGLGIAAAGAAALVALGVAALIGRRRRARSAPPDDAVTVELPPDLDGLQWHEIVRPGMTPLGYPPPRTHEGPHDRGAAGR